MSATKLRVSHYALSWDFNEGKGAVALHCMGDGVPTEHQMTVSAPEFVAVADLLRNEKPIFFDPAARIVSCGMEPVGEAEGM